MNEITHNLEELGFDKRWRDKIHTENLEGLNIARVTAVHKDSYMITNGESDVLAELLGKVMYSANSALDYPAVGDWVLASYYDHNTFAIIHEIIQRKTLLKRKAAGKKIDFQLIAANIDVAFIVQSLDDNFNVRRLERYLTMINESNIKPIVLLSKNDLLSPVEVEERIVEIKKIMPNLDVQSFCNTKESGFKNVQELLNSGITYCLLGSSGVGKTSLLNNLIGDNRFKTKQVREKDSKGRHVTTHRQLIMLDCGAMIVDTPGMRELGNFSIETGLKETFTEITELSRNCLFNDCTHVVEKGCALLSAVKNGKLSEKRYENFLKMNKESAFNEMSYLEKRKKEKQFGKMCKTIMKEKKNLK